MEKLKLIVRDSKFLVILMNLILTPVLKFIELVTKIDDKSIFFISFGGIKYDDSPKKIYETMLTSNDFKDYNFIWAVSKGVEINENKRTITVSPTSLFYFYYLFKSRIWITNVSVNRGFKINSKNRLYINTWHGTPIKKIGADVTRTKNIKIKNNIYYTAQCEYDLEKFRTAFQVEDINVLMTGLPRNEKLFNLKPQDKLNSFKNMQLNPNKTYILYAPTWRDTKDNSVYLDLNIIKKYLSDDQILLYRGHHNMQNLYEFNKNDTKLIDVSEYNNLEDILIISDLLITDYSSIMVDYSIMSKPVILFIKDYDEYNETRGLYFNVQDEFESLIYNDEHVLLEILKDNKFVKTKNNINEYFSPVGENSTEKLLEFIRDFN